MKHWMKTSFLSAALLALGACSIVNSTDDLRDGRSPVDGSVDVQADVVADADLDVADADVHTDVPDAGLDECQRAIAEATFEVSNPVNPPEFSLIVRGDAVPPCGNLAVHVIEEEWRGDLTASFELEMDDEGDAVQRMSFIYDGPRVPIFDDAGRQRTFVINGVEKTITMPVERFQLYAQVPGGDDVQVDGGHILTLTGLPRIDVSNAGRVVFASDDERIGSVHGRDDICLWTHGEGSNNLDVPVRTNTLLGAPSIADDESAIGWITDSSANYLDLRDDDNTPEIFVNSAASHTDVRRLLPGDAPFMLAYVDERNYLGPLGFAALGPRDFVGPGLLTLYAGELGYATAGATAAHVDYGDGETRRVEDCVPTDGTLVHAASDRVAYACEEGFFVEGTPAPYDLMMVGSEGYLIGASDDHEMFLLQNERGMNVATAFVLAMINDGRELVEANLTLDGQGNTTTNNLGSLGGAAISPDGVWVTWTIVQENDTMQLFRAWTGHGTNPGR